METGEQKTLSGAYGSLIKKMCGESSAATHVTPENVYQVGDKKLINYLDTIIRELALPGSKFNNAGNIVELYKKAKAGASCLILPEHYSNTDLPCFSYFLRKELGEEGVEIADSIVAIASIKLNEENPAVAAFASAYSRIVLCPSRYLPTTDGKKDEEERLRIIKINRAAMASLTHIKNKQKMILVFPAGTRYKPWDASTKKGVREIDSYIKSFDYMCFVSINGELLSVREGGYIDDYVREDVVLYNASPVLSCAEFRERVRADAESAGVEDKKQAVASAIMAELEKMHIAGEAERQALLKRRGE